MSGTAPAHLELESELARWLQIEACLLFSSAYAANTSCLAALAEPDDVILSDALNHASIIDGCRLSRARVEVIPHLDLRSLQTALAREAAAGRACWVVTEAYFGMDGVVPDLRRIRDLCDVHRAALLVDEAHSLGVFGPGGRGLCAEAGVWPDLLVGGLGKAFGLQGGFVATSRLLAGWLWNRARNLVFSTAPSPLVCAVACQTLLEVEQADAERAHLRALEQLLDERLRAAGIPLPSGRRGPVFPILFGAPALTLRAAADLAERGFLCQAIRPPTVPADTARLRINLSAAFEVVQVQRLAAAVSGVWRDTRYGAARGAAASGAAVSEPQGNAGGAPRPRADVDAPSRLGGATYPAEGSPALARSARQPGNAHRLDTAAAPAQSPDASSPHGRPISAGHDQEAESARTPAAPHTAQGASSVPRAGRERTGTAKTTRGPIWIVLGTGTGVGKTFVSEGLLRELARRGHPALGLKPIETGLTEDLRATSDAARLAAASFHVKHPARHPLHAFPDPVAPSLAARRQGAVIDPVEVSRWVASALAAAADANESGEPALIVETAGGLFSPLSPTTTNADLAAELRGLGTTTWILVAPDRLGVLHDVRVCLAALSALHREPDWIVLSAPAVPDASTGTNAAELRACGTRVPVISLPRDSTSALAALLQGPETTRGN